MRLFSLFLLIGVMAGLITCGGAPPLPETPEETLVNIPDWYANLPEDGNYLFAAGTAKSRDLQLVVDKAKKNAQIDLASQLEVKTESIIKEFTEESSIAGKTELTAKLTQAGNVAASSVLSKAKVKNQEIKVENGSIFRAYVLMEFPIGEINIALMNEIKNSQDLYLRFKTSQTFADLEKEVEKYRQFKKEHGMIR